MDIPPTWCTLQYVRDVLSNTPPQLKDVHNKVIQTVPRHLSLSNTTNIKSLAYPKLKYKANQLLKHSYFQEENLLGIVFFAESIVNANKR